MRWQAMKGSKVPATTGSLLALDLMDRMAMKSTQPQDIRPTAAKSAHIASLEAMRGLAALWVLLSHVVEFNAFAPNSSWIQMNAWWKQWSDVMVPGHLGVVLFFLLSGYVIGKSNPPEKELRIKEYVAKRFVRLWPCFAVSILFGSLIVGNLNGRSLAEALLLVRPYLPQNPVIWSVCFEFWFYMTFPLIFLIQPNQRRRFGMAAVTIATLLAIACNAYLAPTHPSLVAWIIGLSIWLVGMVFAWETDDVQPSLGQHPKFLSSLLLLMALAGSQTGLQGVLSTLGINWKILSGQVYLADFVTIPLAMTMFCALLGFRQRRWWTWAWYGSLGILMLMEASVLLKGNWLKMGFWDASLILSLIAILLWYKPNLLGTSICARGIRLLAPLGAISYGIYVFHMPSMYLVAKIPPTADNYLLLQWLARLALSLGLVATCSALFDLRVQPYLRRKALGVLTPKPAIMMS